MQEKVPFVDICCLPVLHKQHLGQKKKKIMFLLVSATRDFIEQFI